jgi:hypothetical protein
VFPLKGAVSQAVGALTAGLIGLVISSLQERQRRASERDYWRKTLSGELDMLASQIKITRAAADNPPPSGAVRGAELLSGFPELKSWEAGRAVLRDLTPENIRALDNLMLEMKKLNSWMAMAQQAKLVRNLEYFNVLSTLWWTVFDEEYRRWLADIEGVQLRLKQKFRRHTLTALLVH